MSYRALFWTALVAASGTVGLYAGNVQMPETREQRELHAAATVSRKISDCESRGFQANQVTGECTNIPLPSAVR